jgi:hypothetical protein
LVAAAVCGRWGGTRRENARKRCESRRLGSVEHVLSNALPGIPGRDRVMTPGADPHRWVGAGVPRSANRFGLTGGCYKIRQLPLRTRSDIAGSSGFVHLEGTFHPERAGSEDLMVCAAVSQNARN